jgi:hypothetical protein
MHSKHKISQKGQVIIIVVILFFGAAAMLMLILDGGFGYMYRRNAQNAADAGALAGITEVCGGSADYTGAEALAIEYAETRNGANAGTTVVTFPSAGEITVQTEITYSTFFASLFGRDQMTSRADATAECGNVVEADGVIPAAFPCPPKPEGFTGSVDCGVDFGDPDKNNQPDDDPSTSIPKQTPYVDPGEWNWDKMVIMVDSTSDDYLCIRRDADGNIISGTIECDIDGDGIPDIVSQDSKGWLNLNGGLISMEELRGWILYGYDDVEISPYTWIGHKPGVDDTVYDAIYQREGDTVLVPIVDSFCPGYTKDGPEADCPTLWNANNPFPPDNWIPSEGIHPYYRVVGWGMFHIVCTWSDGERDKSDPLDERCPFRDYLNVQGVLANNLQVKTVEGYFVSDASQGGTGNSGIDFGVYWYWLTE